MSIKKKILLAEDDKFICKAYQDGLTRAGFEVVIAHDGEQALSKIKSDKPDLILLDLIMPSKNGFEVMEDLKKNPSMSKAPVVILSNLGQESDVKKSKDLGAVDYLVKSNYSMKEVIEKVQSFLGKS
jgi:DNA-binding response OmpR family regulator